ncbi:MAG: YwaF family protein [Bacilli bacterium]|nr:YwaF family protein [Bacilli bacterium]
MFLAAANKFLGTNHFIFLGICIAYIVIALILLKKYKVSFNTVLTIMVGIAIASELVKITEYIVPYYDEVGTMVGVYFEKEGLPFHLCSIQVIFLFVARMCKDGSFKEKLLAFMYPTAFLGSLLAMMLATITIEFDRPLAWQYFLYHASLLIYGLYIPMSKVIVIDTKKFLNTCLCLIGLFIVSIYINGLISVPAQEVIQNGEVIGVTEGLYVWFFYSTKPPIKNLPILNLNNGWIVYIISILIIGILAMTLAHLPFLIKDYKKYKKQI